MAPSEARCRWAFPACLFQPNIKEENKAGEGHDANSSPGQQLRAGSQAQRGAEHGALGEELLLPLAPVFLGPKRFIPNTSRGVTTGGNKGQQGPAGQSHEELVQAGAQPRPRSASAPSLRQSRAPRRCSG